jgi:hypothetical protein
MEDSKVTASKVPARKVMDSHRSSRADTLNKTRAEASITTTTNNNNNNNNNKVAKVMAVVQHMARGNMAK